MIDGNAAITEFLRAAGTGDKAAGEKLWLLIYHELRRIALHQMARELADGILQPTALVHEAFLRLTAGENVPWTNRRHFFAAAAKAMRRIRIDDARTRRRLKRGGGTYERIDVEPVVFDQDPDQVLAVDEAIEKLRALDPRKAEVVTMRYFAGLTVDETADALNLSPRTVDRELRFAHAWLHRVLSDDSPSR